MRGASCELLNIFSDTAASAHCLRFDEQIKYRAYTILSPRIEFEINI